MVVFPKDVESLSRVCSVTAFIKKTPAFIGDMETKCKGPRKNLCATCDRVLTPRFLHCIIKHLAV